MSTGIKAENEGTDIVIRFKLKDEYLEVLDERLEHHTSRKLTEGEKTQVICELLRTNIERVLSDWSWYIIGAEVIDVANDVIEEAR